MVLLLSSSPSKSDLIFSVTFLFSPSDVLPIVICGAIKDLIPLFVEQ